MKNTKFGFIDEVGLSVGDIALQPFMAIGMLSIVDTSEIHTRLYKLHYSFSAYNQIARKKLINDLIQNPKPLNHNELNSLFLKNRHHEFKYDGIGFPNLHKYKEILDIIFEYPISFDCIVVDKTGDDFDLDKYGTYWHAYCKFMQLLIKNTVKDSTIIPILDFLHKPNEEQEIVSILNKLTEVENSIQTDSKCHILLQISDLLLGAVIFEKKLEMGLYKTESNKVKARKEFNTYLKLKLNRQNLTFGATYSPIHFNIWNFKPKKYQG